MMLDKLGFPIFDEKMVKQYIAYCTQYDKALENVR